MRASAALLPLLLVLLAPSSSSSASEDKAGLQEPKSASLLGVVRGGKRQLASAFAPTKRTPRASSQKWTSPAEIAGAAAAADKENLVGSLLVEHEQAEWPPPLEAAELESSSGDHHEEAKFIEVAPEVKTHLTQMGSAPNEDVGRVHSQGSQAASATTLETAQAKVESPVATQNLRGIHEALTWKQQQQQRRRPKGLALATMAAAITTEPTEATALIGSTAKESSGATYHAPNEPSQSNNQQQQLDYLTRLYLDTNVPLEVQAHIGNTAYLMCRLRAFQQQQKDHLRVSWVRNMQILTSGEFRYTSDERFRPTHVQGTQDWVLEVHNVNANDEGTYECQVNSEPKPASVSLYLHVMTASMEILESPQVQVEEDEQIRLTCRVEFYSQAQLLGLEPAIARVWLPDAKGAAISSSSGAPLSSQYYIYWYKDNVSLEYNNLRGGIRVERKDNSTILESVLIVEGASLTDSGIYVCRIVPELNEVPIAQTQVIVGNGGVVSGGSSSNSATSSYDKWRLNSSGSIKLLLLFAPTLTVMQQFFRH